MAKMTPINKKHTTKNKKIIPTWYSKSRVAINRINRSWGIKYQIRRKKGKRIHLDTFIIYGSVPLTV